MGDTTTCVYQLVNNEKDSVDTEIIQCFVMHGLGLCIKVDSYVAHMFYAWSFSHNPAGPIDIEKQKYFLFLNQNMTVFAWEAGNSNRNRR